MELLNGNQFYRRASSNLLVVPSCQMRYFAYDGESTDKNAIDRAISPLMIIDLISATGEGCPITSWD